MALKTSRDVDLIYSTLKEIELCLNISGYHRRHKFIIDGKRKALSSDDLSDLMRV